MDDPVVVNPDTVSKNASTKFGILPDNVNGSAPNKDHVIQALATTTIPSFP